MPEKPSRIRSELARWEWNSGYPETSSHVCSPCVSLIVDNWSHLPPARSMDSTSEIMNVLRAGRALMGLSQDELAGLAGVSRQIIVRIERGETNILVDAIERVRAALEARGAVFIDGNSERGPGVAMTRVANHESSFNKVPK
ncbi:helix-turn-helix transcriptional regulator [Rhizobium phaseoli]|uniref:helix-turn-helix transcriptional regulator n=1 Tax=Rhizobium phaseoli TaxID=396 RepID=UPI0030030774